MITIVGIVITVGNILMTYGVVLLLRIDDPDFGGSSEQLLARSVPGAVWTVLGSAVTCAPLLFPSVA